MTGPALIYVVMGLGLVLYVLTAGADFGGGVWDLLARGPRASGQRAAVERSIAPIWEANHVWLIFIIVLLFTGFPRAYATVSVALHIPLTLALVGIVLRGTAFTFRAYGLSPDATRRRWGQVFGWSSVFTPVVMGMVVGAMSSSAIRLDGDRVVSGLWAGWLTPFSFGIGAFALVLFALLAAVYLTVELADDEDTALADDFRARALGCEAVAGALAAFVFWRAHIDAPDLYANLARSAWTWPVQGATFAAGAAAIGLLLTRRFALARIAVVIQVTLVLAGWAAAMDGALILRDVTLETGGARNEVIRAILPGLAVGAALLAPSLWLLFRLFKRPAGPASERASP